MDRLTGVVNLERSPVFRKRSKAAVGLSQGQFFSKGEFSVGALACVIKIIKRYRKCVKEINHKTFLPGFKHNDNLQ